MSVIVGNFNLVEDDRDKLKEKLLKLYNLEFKDYTAEQTTLSGSCIDITLYRYTYLLFFTSLPCIKYDSFVTHVANSISRKYFR